MGRPRRVGCDMAAERNQTASRHALNTHTHDAHDAHSPSRPARPARHGIGTLRGSACCLAQLEKNHVSDAVELE